MEGGREGCGQEARVGRGRCHFKIYQCSRRDGGITAANEVNGVDCGKVNGDVQVSTWRWQWSAMLSKARRGDGPVTARSRGQADRDSEGT